MKGVNLLGAACAAGLLAMSSQCPASPVEAGAEGFSAPGGPVDMLGVGAAGAKSASAQTLGSRSTVTPSVTLFGGFEIRSTADVYILVRGNSLGSLGITQGYLDAPRVRIYDVAGQDLIFDVNGNAGFNNCTTTGTFSAPVRSYYANRGTPSDRDTCTAHSFAAGVYTFTVTPTPGASSPSSGEVLFEVTLNP
jgi:hypothetical protein